MPMMTALEWLRKMLEDDGSTLERDFAVADPGETEFMVSNPAMAAGEIVRVDGALKLAPADYTVGLAGGHRVSVVFGTAPGDGKRVEIQYTRQTWGDDELGTYLAAAETEWNDGSVEAVYQAAVYAVDTIGGVGAATALNFGSGEETYDMVSVWERLRRLRSEWLEWLETRKDMPSLSIIDLVFDVDDPDQDWSGNGIYWQQVPPMPRMP